MTDEQEMTDHQGGQMAQNHDASMQAGSAQAGSDQVTAETSRDDGAHQEAPYRRDLSPEEIDHEVTVGDPFFRAWTRKNIRWVMAEMDLARTGHEAEARATLNP